MFRLFPAKRGEKGWRVGAEVRGKQRKARTGGLGLNLSDMGATEQQALSQVHKGSRMDLRLVKYVL